MDHQTEVMTSAITAGNFDLVQELIECGFSVNGRYQTPLSTSVKEGQLEIADLLIRNGADVNNSGGQFFEPALILAVRACNLDMIHLLIDAGANINGDADFGSRAASRMVYTTPMHVAATKENVDILNILLAANGDVNLRNLKHETPLHLAAYSGHAQNVIRLVACGAILDVHDKQGYTPLHHAIAEGNLQCLRELCKLGSSVNLPTVSGSHPLMLAVKTAQLDSLKALLQFAPDLNRQEELFQRSVAHSVVEACRHRIPKKGVVPINKEIEIMETLVHAGVNINQVDENSETPLHLCVKTGCSALLEFLIKCKHSNEFTVNNIGNSPLVTACSMHGNEVMIKLLIQHCPLLVRHGTKTSKLSQGLMLLLADTSNIHCMRLLLEAGYNCSRLEAETCRELHENDTEIVNFVDRYLLQPWPLHRICRTSVRNSLSSKLHSKIYKLHIPQKIQNMILMEDIFIPL